MPTAAERDREHAYHREEDRRRFRGGALLVRAIGAAALGIPPEQVRVDRSCTECGAPHGRPLLPVGAPVVSVSHSGEWIVVAAGQDGPVGVDIETAEPAAFVDLADQILSAAEAARGHRDADALRRTWVRKEALLKLAGTGLRSPMTAITLADSTPPAVLEHALPLGGPTSLIDIEIHGVPGAIALAGPPLRTMLTPRSGHELLTRERER